MTTKKYLCIRQKKNIVAEAAAYSKPNNIKATARAYLVQPKQIRSWKSMLDGAMVVVPAEVAEIPLQEEGVIQRQVLMKKIAHPGHSPKSAADFEGWRTLFDQLRLQDRACTTRMLSVELKRQPGNENVSLKALEKRIKRWLARKDIVIRRVTRVAQNTRLDQETIQDFVSYVKLLRSNFLLETLSILMRQTSISTCLDQRLWQPEAKGPLGFEQQEIRTVALCC
jgi:hypothetical protein